MTPKVESVLLPAQLKGMNQRVTCSVSAIKVTQPESGEYRFARPKIVGAPVGLPDGEYKVTFAGHSIDVERRKGLWIGN